MKATEHRVTHFYQPTNSSCGYAALASFLSHYGSDLTPEQLIEAVPQPVDETGESFGSISPQLATWCQQQGNKVHMYTFDNLVIDSSWKDLSQEQMHKRMKVTRDKRDAQVFKQFWAKIYMDAYIDLIEAKGKLTVQSYVTSKLLYELLNKGPVYTNICSTVLRGNGHQKNIGLRKSVTDDENGTVFNHSIVIYGNDEKGNFLVSDPWEGLTKIDPETMVVVITASQIECDNLCFVFEK